MLRYEGISVWLVSGVPGYERVLVSVYEGIRDEVRRYDTLSLIPLSLITRY